MAPTDPYHSHQGSVVHAGPVSASSTSHEAGFWSFDHQPEHVISPTFDVFSPTDDYGPHHQFAQEVSDAHRPIFSSFTPVQDDRHYSNAAQAQRPMSPHSSTDWIGLAARETQARPLPRRMQPSPSSLTMAKYAKQDGIRKKNTRIEIPPEHNLDAIEGLINQAKDDDEVKELKGQRRLLRNREAAYV